MKEMWETLKEYFWDSYVPGSAPLGYRVHLCKLERKTIKNGNIRYGVEIDERAMPLFSVHGDTVPPACTCDGMPAIIKHIDAYLETAPDHHPDDYTITSGKDDSTLDQVCLYAMRDTLSWWVHWGGVLSPSNYWKQVYVAFAAVPDDFQLRPQDFLDGSFRFLGHTWADCREGLLNEGLSPKTVEYAEMCLFRQMITQYVEKVDPGLRPLLVHKTNLMTQYRVHTANTLGCLALLMSSYGIDADFLTDDAVEMASVAQCLSLDMAKEGLGVLEGEKTETVAGDRVQLKRELRWVYMRCLEHLGTLPNADVLRRYASCGLHYVPMMDRYLERVRGNVRFPISPEMGKILEPFVKRVEVTQNINGDKQNVLEKENGIVAVVG